MTGITSFFEQNMVIVYFLYGLAFFSMGLAVWLESGRASELRLAHAMGPLAAFGLLHGLHEWAEMFERLGAVVPNAPAVAQSVGFSVIRLGLLVASFLMLIIFSARLLHVSGKGRGNEPAFVMLTVGALTGVWLVSVIATQRVYRFCLDDCLTVIDVLTRYTLAIPGALLASWAMILEQRAFRERGMAAYGRDLQWAAISLVLYGIIGQSFTVPSVLFPSNIINSALFLDLFGVPVQFFRGCIAILVAVFIIRALRAFEMEHEQHLTSAREARLQAQQEALLTQQIARHETEALNQELKSAYERLQARDALRGQLYRRIVSAQEAERQRIARELHDGTGQVLTGLGLGLMAAADTVNVDVDLASQQLVALKDLNARALRELRDLISDLRPSVLDDLGLVPALQGQVQEFTQRCGVEASLTVAGRRRRLPAETEIVLFRIVQEALTNAGKHAGASKVLVHVEFEEERIQMVVSDDGCGFDPQEALENVGSQRRAWGLLGMQERVSLVNGQFEIASRHGEGSSIRVVIPLNSEGKM